MSDKQREDGYYWVRFPNNGWFILEWLNGRFYAWAESFDHNPEKLIVNETPLTPPGEGK